MSIAQWIKYEFNDKQKANFDEATERHNERLEQIDELRDKLRDEGKTDKEIRDIINKELDKAHKTFVKQTGDKKLFLKDVRALKRISRQFWIRFWSHSNKFLDKVFVEALFLKSFLVCNFWKICFDFSRQIQV